MNKNVKELAEKLKIKYTEGRNLQQAIVHRSYLNEHPDFPLGHNERLEFLGDAVLELVVTEYLFENYENPEGELTNWRAALVNGQSLADTARVLGIEEYLLLSKGEQKDSDSKARRYILANAMEAVIGSIYLDHGWEDAKEFVTRVIVSKLDEILEKKLYIDPKSRLQEEAQSRASTTPTYKVLEETGPDHNKIFRIGVYLEKKLIGTGTGSSKQEAQINAAADALEKTNW